MAKKNKKKKKANGRMAGLMAGGVATEIITKALGQLLAEAVDSYLSKKGKKKTQEAAEEPDVAGQLLTALAERGPLSICDLLTSTRAGLTPLLRALREIQEFQLIRTSPQDHLVQLTDEGVRTAAAMAGTRGVTETDSALRD